MRGIGTVLAGLSLGTRRGRRRHDMRGKVGRLNLES